MEEQRVAARYFHQKPTPAKSWYRRDGGARLEAHTTWSLKHFPTLNFRVDGGSRLVFLEGPLAVGSDCGIITSIETRLVFSRNYPELEPVGFGAGGCFKVYPGKTIEDRYLYRTGQLPSGSRPSALGVRRTPMHFGIFSISCSFSSTGS